MLTRTIFVLSVVVLLCCTLLASAGRWEEIQLDRLTEKESIVRSHLEQLEDKLGPDHKDTVAAKHMLDDIRVKIFDLQLDFLQDAEPQNLEEADLRRAVVALAQHVAILQARIRMLEEAQEVRIIPVEPR